MKKIEKIESLYNSGTAKHFEDGHFVNLPFIGVVDGYSAPYNHEENPPILFNGVTGGQMVRNIILATFCSATPDLSLETLALKANKEIKERQKSARDLAGASFLLAKVTENTIEMLQGGDCYALWVKKSGEINITKNQWHKYDAALVKNFAQLMKEFNSDRKKAWKAHFPFLAKIKSENTNKVCANLNGQPEVEQCWQKIEIPLSDLSLLIYFTDGLVPFSAMEDENRLAETVLTFFRVGGLRNLLAWTRLVEKKEATYSHEDHAEATGSAIKFI